ncbi:UNVERIFIED_CONTAM: hypothetical protein Sradi_3322900 [Sesamum radiatum]|uniref:Uncharacterized protein n=1 Tax=Sesamum radiatum TaxID=300843 RepID=A0AAW2R1V7_SESRA
MRSDLQDPFQKEFLQVKLSLLRKSSISASSCQQASSQPVDQVLLAACSSSHPASSRPASRLSSRPGELVPSELVGWQPCQLAGCLSSRPASWMP